MGFPSFLLSFFLVFHLLLSSDSSCPSSFECGHLDPIKFPFTNDTYPQCGLCQLRCREPDPEVVLGEEGTSYQVLSIHDDTLKISDPWLRTRIESKDCHIFSYIIPPNTPSISFTISTNLTFFKCHTPGPAIEDQTDKLFTSNYTHYRGKDCPGFTVYYLYPDNTVPAHYPWNCMPFQLPVVSPVEVKNQSDVFSLLTSDISVECHVPKETGRSHLRLILGIAISSAGIMVILLFYIIFKKLTQGESTFFWKTKTENYRNIKAFLRTCGIAVGIARGLEYLHRGCNTRILHFDIKPHNILLDEDFCPKISDFGLAKLCPQKESIISLLGARGTAGYIAPEVFSRNFGGVSHKSDVYSYGMMVLEIVGGRKNISVGVDHTSEIYFPHWVYKRLELDEELELNGIRDNEANASARKMIIVGLWCIQTDPSHRPSMSRVLEMLEGSLESLLIPPKPFLSSPSRPSVDSSTAHVMKL
ncbi:hypothetical protein Vadar_033702 [Vaccinium darrowii]|uniref:Uncharacterized protein n=1 Tax=Vaccinium darrowii TaxID=229202 RepID=A0ACB7XM59_9ERIC|nr:hypothetical protein Vadar_033702 [Vaccinium darrowii]